METKLGKTNHNGVQAKAVIEILPPRQYIKANPPSNYYRPGGVGSSKAKNVNNSSSNSDANKSPKFEEQNPIYLTGQSMIHKG